MPALLTAVVITCAAMKDTEQPKAYTVNIYHGAYVELVTCRQTAIEMARYFEQAIVNDGRMTDTGSYGECTPAAVDAEVVLYLPKFIGERFGVTSFSVTHYDLVNGEAIDRAKTKPTVKGARI